MKVKFGLLLSCISSIQNNLYLVEYSTVVTNIYFHINKPIYPSLGIFLNFKSRYINDKLSFQYEGFYKKVDYQGYYVHDSKGRPKDDYLPDVPRYKISVNRCSISHTFSVNYTIPKNQMCPFFQLGLLFDQGIKTKSMGVKTDLPLLDKFEMGFTCGLGYLYKLPNRHNIFMNLNYYRYSNLGYESVRYFHTNDLKLSIGFTI